MSDNLQAIVRGLSRLQREALIELTPIFDHQNPTVVANLIFKGLVDYRRRFWLWGERKILLSHKGARVRALLQEKD